MTRNEQRQPLLLVSVDGWVDGVAHIASENCDARPQDAAIDLLVIHNISLPPDRFGGDSIIRLFTNQLNCEPDSAAHPYFERLRGLRVSAHFLIRRNGAIVQCVSCNQRAWHAGVSAFKGRTRCNDFSIGVELEGSDTVGYAPAQYVALLELTLALERRYPLAAVAGHEHIAPGRKTDPGPCFDWRGYRQAYLARAQGGNEGLPGLEFPS